VSEKKAEDETVTEIESRQTSAMTIRVKFDRHKGENAKMTAEEWLFRLRLGGVDAQKVEIVDEESRVVRGKRTEPRS